ncbi:hypothetical protein HS041_04555 [Planomonospora sp. ID67723]|uniref:hypothetical protein n=1 Tax=Planomonospora sp. ID67723 TaxID=2738134 RepID=UPI0018C41AD9|nr:hypothetical protein [Planomonospora sp. ID67723]MBG0827034.1 hypothetical protein [Planomonospora sp. ID67723]
MRIRFLAAAVVTAGALMATLTGAANADTPDTPGTPSPPPSAEKGFSIVCEAGGDHPHITAHKLTDEEMKELAAEGPKMTVRVQAVPADPAGPGGAPGTPQAGHVVVTGPDGIVKRLAKLPEAIEMTLAAPAEPGEAGNPDMKVEVVPAPEEAAAACAEKQE